MNRFRTALLALAATALLPAAAEAGRITVANDAGVFIRVKWKVEDSESDWTTLVLGQSIHRDYPADYPKVKVFVETVELWGWTNLCTYELSPTRSHNVEVTGSSFNVTCDKD